MDSLLSEDHARMIPFIRMIECSYVISKTVQHLLILQFLLFHDVKEMCQLYQLYYFLSLLYDTKEMVVSFLNL